MAPIRVGLIGLAATTRVTMTGAWAVNAHLKSIQALPDEYELVAVANSSVESAQRSIEFHKLPATTKAYGRPEDIAADPNVDLVVVSVDANKHLQLAKPALLRKKMAFVEWPLGNSLAEAEELTKLAADAGVRSMVGLQGRSDPVTIKLKELLAGGKIGQLSSSTVTICTSALPTESWIKGLEHFLDWKNGATMYTIIFGHFLDSFTYLLGDFAEVQGQFKLQVSSVPIIDMETGNVVNPGYKKTSPDHMIITGILKQNEAPVSMTVRKAKAAADKIGFRWYITGTEGEILVETKEGGWQGGDPSQRSIKLLVGKGNEPETVDLGIDDNSAASRVPQPGTNTTRQYINFAQKGAEVVTFESALKTHRLLQKIADCSGYEH